MIGTLLQGRYRLDAELGRGGMGAVYRAHDTLLDRTVAVKLLASATLGSEGRARLLREAQAVAKLNHPNIVSIYDAGEVDPSAAPETDRVPFIVMELVEGQSLFERNPHALDEIRSIAQQICAALDHAHAHGIVHRDLKPENVIITFSPEPAGLAVELPAQPLRVKLMDFGLARSTASRLTVEGALIGTVFYLAPEQALGQPVDRRADLYALGVMLYELTTGRLPFEGDDPLAVIAQHIHAPVTPPGSYRADLPAAFEAVILKLLAKNPADRFASAREVARALAEVDQKPGFLQSPSEVRRSEIEKPGFSKPRNNLPLQLSRFIGREQEIDEVKQLLSALRLVTLTGAGGSGKTRLALQVAIELLQTFPDGAWLVELAPLSDPALVPQAVASTLELREQSERPVIDSLSDYLHGRRLLLVLDNCEHLLQPCAELIQRLLQACPDLSVLATSREAIGITGESAWMVPSLSAPDPQQLSTHTADLVPALLQYEAIRLFVERASAVQPTFALTTQNALTVAQICHRLDGIPLAIELAAARLKALTVEQIAARLDDRLNLLTVGSRTALPRHQTLRGAIDWSYGLLSEIERVLLAHLSVFAHGWTLEAAEFVCQDDAQSPTIPHHLPPRSGGSPLTLPPSAVLDTLTHLVDKSLVIVEQHQNQARYHFLETIRQYAQEKLAESDEAERVQARHVSYYLNMVETAEPHLRDAEQLTWLERLEDEHDNLRAALEWSLARGRTEAALRLVGALARFWYLRGYWSEGREWLQRVLARQDSQTDALKAERAKALYGAGWLADETGPQVPLYQESLALCREVDDKWGTAFSLRGLGVSEADWGDDTRALAHLNESLALFREVGDRWGIALALFNQGWLSSYHNDQAESVWEESLSLFRTVGDRWGMAVTIGALGFVARIRGDYKPATRLSKESLQLFRELGDRAGIATSLGRLGQVAYRRDDLKQTVTFFEESLALQRELGYQSEVAFSLYMLGLAACYQGDYLRASAFLEDSLTRSRDIGDRRGIAVALDGLALLAHYQSDDMRAADLWEESLTLFRELDDKSGSASALHGLGCIALRQGDHMRAHDWLAQSLSLYREVGDKLNIAIALNALGRQAHAQGDPARAAALYRESLTLRRDMGARRGIAESLEDLARLSAVQDGRAEVAARLFGAAEAMREALGTPRPPVELPDYERGVSTARTASGDDAFVAAWAEGRSMTIEQAITLASEKTKDE
ncbi:MAG TPA: tetratricopeptide repeat protein [Anaerolineae bacterium]|nr:tetratricopeptide repeat protein [Anaerolineae bacterium]